MLVKSIKTLIVEDSTVLAERLKEIIHMIPEIDLVAVVESESEARAILRQGRVDVVILDLQLREGTGIGVLGTISGLAQKPKVIVLTNHDVAVYEDVVRHSGAEYLLDKARDFQRLPLILAEITGAAEHRPEAEV